ncbi:peptidoglycan/LPS O-acetylase OafA/YrhL [Arthrobacter sp. V4I6]|nr:peptidoglycan/LPS O-acetylase OafA/YrhL [Arthrobacter sp. V1I7]MDQ0854073.1 peptidoglycan/LPS O-acetylase OafA/YrhL [Arthrobacter sp. V4I6]
MMATPLEGLTKRATAKKAAFRPDIQGMRALAVLGVVLYHAGIPWLPGGYIGVDVFFVISGYLITGLLFRELQDTGRIALGSFYARRIRRLLPASAVVLVVTLAAAKLLLPAFLLADVSRDAMATSAFLSNMLFAYTSTDYLAGTAPSLFQHYWSLALEEQFYLVWPLIMVAAAGAALGRRKRIGVVLFTICVVSLAACIILTQIDQPWAFFGLHTRAWELGAGALLALSSPAVRRLHPWLHRALAWSGLALILGSMAIFTEELIFPGWAAVFPVLGTVALIAGGCGETQPLAFLSSKTTQYFGNISYSLYLWHWPLLTIPVLMWDGDTPWWMNAAGVAASIGLAHLTVKFVERKFQHAAIFSQPVRRSYALGAGLTIVAMLASFGLGRLPSLDAGRPALAPTNSQRQVPAVAGFVPSDLSPSIRDSGKSLPVIYEDGCHVGFGATSSPDCTYGAEGESETVVLFGDSHAAQWFSPLRQIAEESNIKLVSLTKSSCPSVSLTVRKSSSSKYPECDIWRANAIDRIKTLKPSVVIISNYSSSYRALGQAGPAGYAAAWKSGLAATLDRLPRETAVVVLGDTPTWPESPNVCLSAHVTTAEVCAAPLSGLRDKESLTIERKVVQSAGGKFILPSEWLCGDRCSPIAGNVLVYRDEHHVTDEMAATLASRLKPVVARALRE